MQSLTERCAASPATLSWRSLWPITLRVPATARVHALKTVVKPRQKPAKSASPVTDMRGNLFARERLKIERALRSLAGGLDYGDWIRVGMALKSTGANDALGLWIELFRHYPGYQQGECEAKWETFNGNVAGRVLWQRQPGRSSQARPELA